MAKGKFIKILEILRGKAAGLVVRQRPDGTFIFSGPPTYKKGSGTPAQKAHWKHVSQVGPYASALARIHPIYAQLAAEPEAKEKWLSAYNFAFADCMKPPVIQHIERREGCIRVEASDNIGVARVRVFVLDEAGNALEYGDAVQAEGDWWEYATHTEGKQILAKAFDLPGNCTQLEISIRS
jgi:hypothetical protein